MTRNEQRAACIRAIKWILSIYLRDHSEEWYERAATAAFDALHDLARVCPVEATKEMIEAGCSTLERLADDNVLVQHNYHVMSAAGDLTNAPEKKP